MMSSSTHETVIVRDRDGLRQLEATDDWSSMTLLGALSSDPRSFDELARAWLRYQPEQPLQDLPWIAWGGQRPQGPWVLIDLACLRVLAGGGAKLPDNRTAYQRDEGPWNPEIPVVWINFPPDWQWEVVADFPEPLPPLPVPLEPLDVRGILFGRALAEGIAQRTCDLARLGSLPATRICRSDSEQKPLRESQRKIAAQWRDLTVRVHADWLMTARDDLAGQTPRHYLHDRRDWVEREMANRQMQWSNERRAPRPLDRDTFAYRYGPIGRHEVVMYFDLCRDIIHAAWDKIADTPEIDEATLTQALHERAQRWLSDESLDFGTTPPAVIIDTERRHEPLVGDGSELDCECPLCRMQAEGAMGPMFQIFDGFHLEVDGDFAFSLSTTREQWEREQEDFREMSAEIDAQQKEREKTREKGRDEFESVWTRSYINQDSTFDAGPASTLSIMAVAMRVAELVADLKSSDSSQPLVKSLNDAFDAFRAADADPALSAAATTQFAESLEQIAGARPELTSKIADLQSQLDERRRRTDCDFPF